MEPQELKLHFYSCMPLFIALGDEVRLHIIESLSECAFHACSGDMSQENISRHGLNVKEITEKTNLSRPAISHHLKILKDAGLVGVNRQGTHNYYYLTIREGTKKLMQLGSELETFLNNGSR